MVTYGFLADGLFTLSQNNKGNEFNRYCKLEGMDCQHLISESNSIRNLLSKRKNPRIDVNRSGRKN